MYLTVPSTFWPSAIGIQRFGSGVIPSLVDVDGDGDVDLVLGVGEGSVQYYERVQPDDVGHCLPSFRGVTSPSLNLCPPGPKVSCILYTVSKMS